MSLAAHRIAENLARVREQLATAALRAGRNPSEVTLVGVTKYVSATEARLLFEAGCPNLGESRPQELWQKAAALSPLPVCWHLIGHLQRNKVRRTLPLVNLIHSVDSSELLREIEAEAQRQKRETSVLFEVNISGEAAKHGLEPPRVAELLRQAEPLSHVRVCGLMAMASLAGGPEQAAQDFSRVSQLREKLLESGVNGKLLAQLSLGMSGDFAAAIAAGSTIVRIGSALWEGLV